MAEYCKGRWRICAQFHAWSFGLGFRLGLHYDFNRQYALELYLGPFMLVITIIKKKHLKVLNR